jgi:hypothetical protein
MTPERLAELEGWATRYGCLATDGGVLELVSEVRRLQGGIEAMRDEEFAHSFNVDGPTAYVVETSTIDDLISGRRCSACLGIGCEECDSPR